MSVDYPDDADGDALRRVARSGNDMLIPMEVDFAVVLPDEDSANAFAKVVAERGYLLQPSYDNEDDAWTVYCTKRMVVTYDGVLETQAELDKLSGPFGGYSDGWGTYGNVEIR